MSRLIKTSLVAIATLNFEIQNILYKLFCGMWDEPHKPLRGGSFQNKLRKYGVSEQRKCPSTKERDPLKLETNYPGWMETLGKSGILLLGSADHSGPILNPQTLVIEN